MIKRRLITTNKPDGFYKSKIVSVGDLPKERNYIDLFESETKVYRSTYSNEWTEWHVIYKMLVEAGLSDEEIVEFDLNTLINRVVEYTVRSVEKSGKIFSNVVTMKLVDCGETKETEKA